MNSMQRSVEATGSEAQENKTKERNTMQDLRTTKALVTSILERDRMARNSDSHLYLRVINTIADKNHIDLTKIPVIDFLLNMSKSPFPPFESVRRSRQKVQHECPWLAASAEVEEARAENEHEYREFARG